MAKNGSTGKASRTITIILAAVMVFELLIAGFKYPGWLKKGEHKDSPEFVQTSDSAEFSAETLTAKTESGISVKLTDNIYEDGLTLTYESIEPLYAENGDYVILPYDISVGELHKLDDFAEIRIPFDSSFCDDGANVSECTGAVYFNEETEEWEDILFEIDEAAKEVVIETDHFSTFGVLKVKNEGKRNAYITGSETVSDENIDESKAIAVMSRFVETNGEESETAKLFGSEIMMGALCLTDAASTTTDAVGNVFSIATYLDGIDLAMKGDWNSLQIFDKHTTEWIAGSKPDVSLFYDNGFAEKTSNVLSKVGNTISAVKLMYSVGKAATGNADSGEILSLYKDSASLAISLSGNATLGALMCPVFIADKFITYCFEEGMAIKAGQMTDAYEFFNYKFEGSGSIRAGRDLKAWRKVIIDLIKENPDADSEELIESEIDDFALDFWKLDAEELAEVASCMPGNVKRIPDTTQKERNEITEAYKAQLYKELTPVMTSVRNYFVKKAAQQAQKEIAAAKKLYNTKIPFSVFEALELGEEAMYSGCTVRFMPLSIKADKNDWTFVLDKNGSVSGEFTYLGYLSAGCPYAICVYEKGENPDSAEPILTVNTGIKENACRTILERREQKEETTAAAPTPFPLETDLYIKRSESGIYKTGNYLYKGKTAHLSVDKDGAYKLTIPAISGESSFCDAGMSDYTYSTLSADGFTVEGSFDVSGNNNDHFSSDTYDISLNMQPSSIAFSGTLTTETNWGGGDVRTTGPSQVNGQITHDSERSEDRIIFDYISSENKTEIDLEFYGKATTTVDGKVKQDNDNIFIKFDFSSEKPQ